ncbi:MAG TPA: cupin domain-containing protein [Candidatus Saccharimonadales bacterium]|nr:cupin domain-containing protein [Candidatus Saccharimonadales bacterium]
MSRYKVVHWQESPDFYKDTDVPGEFRRLSDLLGTEQLSISFIKVPAHSDFQQSTGHSHEEIEELYIIAKGTLSMRFDDDIVKVPAGSAVRVSPTTVRSHRNEGDEDVEMWAISKKIGRRDAKKVDNFWEPSESAKQTK